MIHDCKGSLTWIANDPVKKLWNGNGAVYKVKEKDHQIARSQVNLYNALKKKKNKSENDMVSTARLPLAMASNFVSSL